MAPLAHPVSRPLYSETKFQKNDFVNIRRCINIFLVVILFMKTGNNKFLQENCFANKFKVRIQFKTSSK